MNPNPSHVVESRGVIDHASPAQGHPAMCTHKAMHGAQY